MEVLPKNLPLHGIFLMILIVSANFLAETFPCRIQKILQTNMLAKHVFGFFTMMFFVVSALPDAPNKLIDIFKDAGTLYIIFAIMTKTHPTVFILIMFILGVIYLLYLRKNEINKNHDTNMVREIEYIDTGNQFLQILTIFLIALGFLMYLGEKKAEYKNNFRYDFFLLGKPTCSSGRSTPFDAFKGLRYVFT
tara:strand:- start:671 stop:1249 length:579 start_codon:yes stop_codon:yes gene_type:complete